MSPRWYTFFADGQVFEDLPRTGLAGFDRNASRSDPNQASYWGTWQFAAGTGTIAKPGVRFPEKLKLEQPALLVIDIDRFSRCAAVDGLRLDGTWTSFANANDPELMRLPAGKRPLFQFSRDGRFVDEGVFATFLRTYGNEAGDAAGSGTYDIRDFTLTLRYSDGRVRRTAFSGMLGADPAVRNDIVFIGRSQFNRKK
jgi:hypothetical protein